MQEEFDKDFQKIIKNHTRQIQMLKSKIWELENFIINRPARAEEAEKIRNLNLKAREL